VGKLHTVNSLFEALKGIIANLPERACQIDIHLEPQEVPTMTVKFEIWAQERPVLKDGAIVIEVKRFKIEPLDE
jgi:hypothetical protein